METLIKVLVVIAITCFCVVATAGLTGGLNYLVFR